MTNTFHMHGAYSLESRTAVWHWRMMHPSCWYRLTVGRWWRAAALWRKWCQQGRSFRFPIVIRAGVIETTSDGMPCFSYWHWDLRYCGPLDLSLTQYWEDLVEHLVRYFPECDQRSAVSP